MPEHETQQADRAERSAVLPVESHGNRASGWISTRHLPDFAGAYLWAGITALSPDAPFPLYRDVDVVVVLPEGAQDDTVEVFYRGVMLEVISWTSKPTRTPKPYCQTPATARTWPRRKSGRPYRNPPPLHRKVAAEYGRRRWIEARCGAEKASADKHLAAMRQAITPQERLDSRVGISRRAQWTACRRSTQASYHSAHADPAARPARSARASTTARRRSHSWDRRK